jgi:hypothetical protein
MLKIIQLLSLVCIVYLGEAAHVNRLIYLFVFAHTICSIIKFAKSLEEENNDIPCMICKHKDTDKYKTCDEPRDKHHEMLNDYIEFKDV